MSARGRRLSDGLGALILFYSSLDDDQIRETLQAYFFLRIISLALSYFDFIASHMRVRREVSASV